MDPNPHAVDNEGALALDVFQRLSERVVGDPDLFGRGSYLSNLRA